MPRLPTSFLVPLVRTLGTQGPRVLEAHGLSPSDLSTLDTSLEVEAYDRIALAAAEGNPAVGLEHGSQVDLRQLGLVAWILQNAPTVGAAVGHYRHYNRIVCSGIRYDLELHGTRARFQFVGTIPGRTIPRPVNDAVLTSFLKILGQLAGEPARVLEVRVPHAPDGTGKEYVAHFGQVPRFSAPAAGLDLDSSFLDRKVVYADPGLLEEFRGRADRVLEGLGPGRVSLQVAGLLASRYDSPLSLPEAARELGWGTRTLQEHLKREGTTFLRIRDQVGKERALAELSRQTLSVGEIAWMLGYSEQSAFQVAFKRWTGKTPLEFRRSAGRQAGSAVHSSP